MQEVQRGKRQKLNLEIKRKHTTREETMKIWITGGAGSGKSSLAQELAATLAAGEPHYYVATMVPRDDEDRRRISRHIEDRAGMGFRTIE